MTLPAVSSKQLMQLKVAAEGWSLKSKGFRYFLYLGLILASVR